MKKLILSVAAAICSFAAFALTYTDTSTSIVWTFDGTRDTDAGLWSATITGAQMVDGSAVSNAIAIPAKLGEYNVTKIAAGFAGNQGITAVTLPPSLKSIDCDAFAGSKIETDAIAASKTFVIGDFLVKYTGDAETFTTPAGVKAIAESAFSGSTVSNIVLSDDVALICPNAFNRTTAFTSITFGKGITELPKNAMGTVGNAERLAFTALTKVPSNYFYYNRTLKDVTLGDACEGIEAYAFGSSSVTNINLGAKLAKIGNGAFQSSSLKAISLPATLKKISDSAFNACGSLEKVTFAEGLTEIEEDAFNNCSALKEIVLPASLEKIGGFAFSNCDGLEKVTFAGNSALVWIGDNAFASCLNLGEFDVPASVEYMGTSILNSCSSLTNLTGGAGIKELDVNALGNLSKLCEHSSNLTFKVVTFANVALGYQGVCPAKLTTDMLNGATAIAANAFKDTAELTEIDIAVSELGNSVFENCTKLEKITLSGDLTIIPTRAFMNAGSKSGKTLEVKLPEGITRVDARAFFNSAITSVELPNCTVVASSYLATSDGRVYYGSFEGCTNLTSVKFGENRVNLNRNTFRGCVALTSVEFAGTAFGCAFEGCTALTQVTIKADPEGFANEIGAGCFNLCSNLTSVALGGVTQLGEGAFNDCVKLATIDIPETVTDIGGDCFAGCAVLKTVTGGAGLKHVGYAAFSDTPWFKESTESILKLGSTVIAAKNLTVKELALEESITAIAGGAFEFAASLEKITIPSQVDRIEDYTFGGCSNLMLVIYKNCDIDVNYAAFLDFDWNFGGNAAMKQITTKPGYFFTGWNSYSGYGYDCGKAQFTPVSFRAEGFENDGEFAGNANYQGWLKSGKVVVGKITVKAAKIDAKTGRCKVTAVVEMAGVKKTITDSFIVKDGKGVAGYTKLSGLENLQLGANWLTGKIDFNGKSYSIEGGVDAAKGEDPFDAYKGGLWAIAIQPQQNRADSHQEDDEAVKVPSIGSGYCGITVSAAAKGKVKIGGFLPDGTKVSATAQMVMGDNKAACAPVVIQTAKGKKGGFSFLVWFYTDELGNNVMYADKENAIGNWVVPVDFFTDPYVYIPMSVVKCGAIDPTDKCGLAVGLNDIYNGYFDVEGDYNEEEMESFTVTEKGKWEFAKQRKVSLVTKMDDVAERLLKTGLTGEQTWLETEDKKMAVSYWDRCYNGELQYFGYLLYDYGTKVKKGVVTPGKNTSEYGFKFSYAAKTGLAKGSYTEILPVLDEDKEKVSLQKVKHTCNAVVIDQEAYGADTYVDTDKEKYADSFTITKW